MTRGQRTRVAAYALSTDESGRILLCRIAPSIAAGEIWTLPGGGLEFGEPPEVAVCASSPRNPATRARSSGWPTSRTVSSRIRTAAVGSTRSASSIACG